MKEQLVAAVSSASFRLNEMAFVNETRSARQPMPPHTIVTWIRAPHCFKRTSYTYEKRIYRFHLNCKPPSGYQNNKKKTQSAKQTSRKRCFDNDGDALCWVYVYIRFFRLLLFFYSHCKICCTLFYASKLCSQKMWENSNNKKNTFLFFKEINTNSRSYVWMAFDYHKLSMDRALLFAALTANCGAAACCDIVCFYFSSAVFI